MSTQPLFYKKIIPLNKEEHGNIFVEPIDNYNHTKKTNSLYIAAIEFTKACKEYPIVFSAAADDNIFPVVLLGLKKDENLYVGKKGEWDARYIPAYVRRYPFILASSSENGGGDFTVCIDESYPGFNIDKKGQPLFNDKGDESELLKQSVEFLKDYQNQIQLTTIFCNTLKDSAILDPMQANVELIGGEKFSLGGFMVINRTKLKELSQEKLADLVKTDQMELIFAHLSSLDNINSLMQRLT